MPQSSGRRSEQNARHKTGNYRRRSSRRELGQNFLRDERTARRIVDESGVRRDDLVIEIGAGGGMLTRQLARTAGRVVAVECDPFWVARLKERFSAYGNVLVVRADARELELPEEPFVVVANIPFQFTTSLLHRLLDDPTSALRCAHLVVQKQVARKHAGKERTTLKTLNWSPWYEFSAGLGLPADAFNPRPRVDACLMVAAKRGPPLVEPGHRHLFRALAHRAFEGRGNSLGKVLRPTFTRTQLRRLASDNGFSLNSYPSELTVYQWTSVFDFMVTMIPPDLWPRVGRF
jgi:23S rRNA (adenine-N6)-dimethyltransferase